MGLFTTSGVRRGAQWLAALLTGILTMVVGASEYTLREHLGLTWEREPVAFTLTFPAGGGKELVAVTANGNPTAFQAPVHELTHHGDGSLATARVHVVTDLQPEGTIVFQGRTEGAPSALPPSDLHVTQLADAVEFRTSGFGVRLLLGTQQYEAPVASTDVPGPVRALQRGNGTWFGGSDLFGESRVRGYSARLLGAGPVFGQVACRYEYEDGAVAEATFTLHAGGRVMVIETLSVEDRPENGFRLELSEGLPPLVYHANREHGPPRPIHVEQGTPIGGWAEMPLQEQPAGVIAQLTPWADWWWSTTHTTIRLGIDGERELQIGRRHAGRWVKPEKPGTMRTWSGLQHKMLPLEKGEDGSVFLRFNHAQGERHVHIGEHFPDEKVGYAYHAGAQVIPEELRLDDVKEMILAWPAGDEPHPRLFMTGEQVEARRRQGDPDPEILQAAAGVAREEIRPVPSYKDTQALAVWLATNDDEWAAKVRLVERLRHHLGLLGNFDRMRSTEVLASLYDGLIDSHLISAEERNRLRARMALVAYQLADPATWSIERGYRSYNPNMSVSYTLALGTVACLLRDHPMADAWIEPAMRMTRHWFDLYITPHGEWLESMHYAQVSAGDFLTFGVAAQQAGFHDFFQEPALQRLGLYLAQQYTPPDPRHMDRRVTPPVGRGTAGMAWQHFGVFAQAMRHSTPAYAAQMQWMWQETNHAIGGVKLGGYQSFYCDPELPAQAPAWGTERFPNVSIVFRHGVGHPQEHYLNFLAVSDTYGTVRPQEVGSIVAWFAYGKPVSMAFCQPEDFRMHRLMNQVTPASWPEAQTQTEGDNRGPTREVAEQLGFARLPLAEYSSTRYRLGQPWGGKWKLPELPDWPEAGQGEGPVEWQRQVLFLRDDTPDGRHYLVLRDSILNEQPTRWHFWTLSHKLDTTDAASREGFLDELPGTQTSPARELAGDRFTARGLYGVDLAFYVASPVETPRHTLRYGGKYAAYAVRVDEYQDLLHLQMPGKGSYYTAIVPQPNGETPAAFDRLDGGKIIRVADDAGVDFLLLAETPTTAEDVASGVAFETAAGAVLDRQDSLALILSEPGRVRLGEVSLVADGPAQLRRVGASWTLHVDPGEEAEVWNVRDWENITRRTVEPQSSMRIEIHHPDAAAWTMQPVDAAMTVERQDKQLVLVVPRHVRTISFTHD